MTDDTDEVTAWNHPMSLTIPCPIELSKKRGMFAKKADDFPASIRLTPHDKILIEREARAIGVSFSTFMRWCGVQAARELCGARTGQKPKADL